jgi:hypothetical protein
LVVCVNKEESYDGTWLKILAKVGTNSIEHKQTVEHDDDRGQ